MKKKIKIIIIIAAAAILLAAITIVLYLNWHNIFLFCEKNGFFCREIEIEEREDLDLAEYSLSDLEKDSRVTFDQSLMLVNTLYTLPHGFEPQVSEYKSTTVYMNNCMLDAYASLSAAVTEKTGKKLYVSSDLRTEEDQEVLYQEDPLTATVPGASEHQTGLALDVYVAYFSGDGFIRSKSGRFVNSKCWEYGFIIRYPSYAEDVTRIRFEPWHIRYVGHPHSDVIYNNHITLEEYILSMDSDTWYEIDGYFVSRQKLSSDQSFLMPTDFSSCMISPDNTGNYIITIKK